MSIPEIRISDFTYELPEYKIPGKPLENRDDSKLLVYQKGVIQESIFKNINQYLPSNAHLVFNNTKVFPARLIFSKATGAKIEVFCLQPLSVIKSDGQHWKMNWEVMVGNLKRWKQEEELSNSILKVSLLERKVDTCIVQFNWTGDANFYDLLEKIAELPLPPYMNRKANAFDKERYQTVYAHHTGSVAAPTAGLHFTDQVLSGLKNKGHQISNLALHVGAGTFKPVKAEKIADHEMHSEHFIVSKELIESIINGDFILPVGTTSTRVLESLYWLGVEMIKSNQRFDDVRITQWVGYSDDPGISMEQSLKTIVSKMVEFGLQEFSGQTSIIIMPGYKFRVCKGIITNFHQPQSTLILLVAALLGNDWRRVYEFALTHDFRFLSYGDSSLLLP